MLLLVSNGILLELLCVRCSFCHGPFPPVLSWYMINREKVILILYYLYASSIAERLPEQTIQEDSNLLMYYDISLGRV